MILLVLKQVNEAVVATIPIIHMQNSVAQNSMKPVNVNVDQMQAFVITNSVAIMINADVNVKN